MWDEGRFRELERGWLLGRKVLVAASGRSRLLGLAHLDLAQAPAGLLIPRCRCVHTFGMRFALDLHFLDEGGAVVEQRLAVPPRRIAFCGSASAVLEIPVGEGGEFAARFP